MNLEHDTFPLTLVCLLQPWDSQTELHQFCSLEENSQPAEPSLPQPCCHGKPGWADPAFAHGTVILGEKTHYFFLKNSLFFKPERS